MNNKSFIYTLALLFLTIPVNAQRAKKKAAGKKKVVVEVPQEDPRLVAMREATQCIVFIDSIVVDKTSFLAEYHLSPESGKLMPYADFFHKNDQPYSIVYQNELGNKAWFSNTGQLYTIDLLGGKEWTSPIPLSGLEDEKFSPANYPFMMADGTTLYFAAGGPESIGGLDIFVTRYDSNTGHFLLPENVGMPFNSEANDYMMAIDEINNIGYFATDRRQAEGKVCIYTFIPSQTRRIYNADELDEQTLRSYAEIRSIADSWQNSHERESALERLNTLRNPPAQKTLERKENNSIHFQVDDQTTYHALADFRVLDNRTRFKELQQIQNQVSQLNAELNNMRLQYAQSSQPELLTEKIIQTENQINTLLLTARQMEKTIRNTEIKSTQKD